MGKLVECAGLKAGQVECATVHSQAELFRTLKPGLAAIAAGDNGCLSVWIGDDGYFYTTFYRFQALVNGVNIIGTKKKLREWLREWWPQIGDRAKLATL